MKVLKFIGMGILGLGLVALFVFVTMSLWNWLVPVLFHGPVIDFWQTAGLLALSKILFSGFGCRGGHGRRHHKHHNHHGEKCCDHRWWNKYRQHGECCKAEKQTEQ